MPPKLTTEKWIERVENSFPNRFTFNKTNYTGQESPITITCKHHGDITMDRSKSIARSRTFPCKYCSGYLPKFDGTQKWLRKWLYYNRNNGGLYNRATKQKIGFTKQDGYIDISFDGVQYKEHRLVYKYLQNKYPKMIDHINRDKADNRIENLRPASISSNAMNKTDYKPRITSSFKYGASIKYMGKTKYLGSFDTEEEAINVMQAEREKYMNYEEAFVEWIVDDIV